jgi:hypothetical protein
MPEKKIANTGRSGAMERYKAGHQGVVKVCVTKLVRMSTCGYSEREGEER